jgi:outer membrane protein assembly factor BamB
VVLRGDLDQVLVIADLQGHILAVEESSGKELWSQDLGAAEIGRFLDVGKGRLVMALDGSRLACWQTSIGSAKELWSRSLDGQPIGGPVLSEGVVYVSVGAAILRNTVDGAELASIALPSPATTAMQFADGHIAAVGCARQLVIFVDGSISWTTPVPSPISAVGCIYGTVIAALDDGTILAYQL